MFIGILLFILGMFIATQNTQSKIAWPLIIVGLVLIAVPARAQHAGHPPEHQAIHERFYKNWHMPNNRAVSCCHNEDCKPAEAYQKDGQWFARQEGDPGEFTPIPKERVDMGLPDSPDPPDMRAHLCGRRYGFSDGGFTVFCFISAPGG